MEAIFVTQLFTSLGIELRNRYTSSIDCVSSDWSFCFSTAANIDDMQNVSDASKPIWYLFITVQYFYFLILHVILLEQGFMTRVPLVINNLGIFMASLLYFRVVLWHISSYVHLGGMNWLFKNKM